MQPLEQMHEEWAAIEHAYAQQRIELYALSLLSMPLLEQRRAELDHAIQAQELARATFWQTVPTEVRSAFDLANEAARAAMGRFDLVLETIEQALRLATGAG